ncbi:DUF2357 domain-containing protein [Nonomuraea sp. MCN248]|uniref:DUF2357 domain-containing protein n=1 Tax=Nonomuraea corallina TaxID=2989783 RepID=A0ABT4S3Y2_9ACTN|nr:DUF2357 domain-containing protein [Nonomuraea corallina]MDA0631904.1 DUF2357 domain-containing protein [Nonomuraea corallina]
MCAGTLNFGRQVGLATLAITVGHQVVQLVLEVFPTKIDYKSDYQNILSDISRASRTLAFEYLRATHQKGKSANVGDQAELDWIVLLRHEIHRLSGAINRINQRPHRTLVREGTDVRLEKVKKADSYTRKSVSRGMGSGGWSEIYGIGPTKNLLPTSRSVETLDTPEHRWLRMGLLLIRTKLADVQASLKIEASRQRSMTQNRSRLIAEMKEVEGFVQSISDLLNLPLFNGLTQAPPPGFTSLTLMSGVGYSDAYQAISTLRLGLTIEQGSIEFSTMDVHALYETWCFIEVLRIVVTQAGGQADLSSIISVDSTGIRVRMRQARRSSVGCRSGTLDISLSYNESYSGLTGEQRPDIVLRLRHSGWPDLYIIFDAKYRLDASASFRKRFGCAGPPADAINALHRYRDAIVVGSHGSGTLTRPVVKGAALYPLSVPESVDFSTSRLKEALDVLGIGAIPFLPGNTHYFEAWIAGIFALPPEELAEPGPPYVGLAEKKKRSHSIP